MPEPNDLVLKAGSTGLWVWKWNAAMWVPKKQQHQVLATQKWTVKH